MSNGRSNKSDRYLDWYKDNTAYFETFDDFKNNVLVDPESINH